MDQETNLNSIRVLEKERQKHERAIIRLKRAQNSLLNVSKLPPEILGIIFHWSAIPGGDFNQLPAASHNFLLVCRYWYRVARKTPSLWVFWGTSIHDWKRWHARCKTAPLNLVLWSCWCDKLGDELRDALQDCAARDVIRRICLEGLVTEGVFESIISSIIIEGEEPRPISLDSLQLWNRCRPSIDLSDLFSRYHFPKLQRLELLRSSVPWDLLGLRTSSLTTLSLTTDNGQLPLPTMSQMLLILSANPNLRSLTLENDSVPRANSDGSTVQIRLRHLETLRLSSTFHRVFRLLDHLEHPDEMDDLRLFLSGCPSNLLQTLGPYLGNHVRRESADKLHLTAYCSPGFHVEVGDFWNVRVGGRGQAIGIEEQIGLCFDLITLIPQERVVSFATDLPILRSEELCVRMHDLTHLRLTDVDIPDSFTVPAAQETHMFRNALPSLSSITISGVAPEVDWSPLTQFLAGRTAEGNRIHSLALHDCPQMTEDVAESVRRLVGKFEEWPYVVDYSERWVSTGKAAATATHGNTGVGLNPHIFCMQRLLTPTDILGPRVTSGDGSEDYEKTVRVPSRHGDPNLRGREEREYSRGSLHTYTSLCPMRPNVLHLTVLPSRRAAPTCVRTREASCRFSGISETARTSWLFVEWIDSLVLLEHLQCGGKGGRGHDHLSFCGLVPGGREDGDLRRENHLPRFWR
jgi:hypothetical protein